MTGWWKKSVLGLGLAATALSSAAPAEAQRYGRYRDRGGNGAASALIGGVIGLGLGAALASGNRGRYDDRRYYDGRRYYDDRVYVAPPPRVYYREYAPPPPPPRVYYEQRGYYGRDYYRGYDAPGYYGW